MPRKPGRSRHFLRHPPPFTFSPFSRTMSLLYSAQKVKHESKDTEVKGLCAPGTSGNGFLKDCSLKNTGELSDSSDGGEFEGVIQADFAFFDPKPKDFHGLKVLLQTYLDDKQWDLSGFVDIILEQTTVGSVVKIENDEDEGVYAFVSALNMGRYKDHKCFIELKEYLLKVCPKEDVSSNLRSLLEESANEVGLLVSQRVVNLPPQLLPHLYDALFDEVSWATEDEPTEELRKSFCFNYYLLICKIYKHKTPEKKSRPTGKNDDSIIFTKAEDENFHELSSWSFSFPLHIQKVTDSELKDYRLMGLVMAIEANKVSTFRKRLHSLIDES
ncbi:hypothetical protein M9H77_14287 [Catharanthus roseus]|uniref:Uncharacterized protein n=1 Tax=Catharanthus roseus TaxID=4058 RepID=A0ACC0BMT1_CATRO|nr:hypothetical protein M9H77_14287 [Catharanthus roseus]